VSHPLLFLHGAIGSSAQLKPLADELRQSGFDPKLFDFSGHGGREIPEGPFSIPLFAAEVISWMNEQRITSVDIFGYSMGGYVALYLAKYYPDRIGRILTMATKLAWDIPTSQKEVKMLDPKKIREKVPAFASALEKRHGVSHWEKVLSKTAEMMLKMGIDAPLNDESFSSLKNEIQLCVGDRDTMVSMEETIHVYRLLQNAKLCVLPATPHPIEQMNISLLKETAISYFGNNK
jgi:pimeloyl-ACP methyl ester carboxylesterase